MRKAFPCTSYRYVKLGVAHAPGMPGTFSSPSRVSDPDMHHGTCVTHVPWCMLGSLTSDFLWSRWRGKRYRHSACATHNLAYLLRGHCYRHVIVASHWTMITTLLNSLKRSDTYMRHWNKPSLVQIIACRLFGAKPLPEPLLFYCKLDPKYDIRRNFNRKFTFKMATNSSASLKFVRLKLMILGSDYVIWPGLLNPAISSHLLRFSLWITAKS